MNSFLIACLLTISSWIVPLNDWGVKGEVYFENSPYKVEVEVAYFEHQKAQGLMFRENLPLFKGMLFPYEVERKLSFWMKNTYIPLYIIFLDSHLQIESFYFMEPLNDKKIYYSKGPAMYALELSPETFSKIKPRIGERVYIEWKFFYNLGTFLKINKNL